MAVFIRHSPRMQYHVSSLVKDGYDVDFVGFRRKSSFFVFVAIYNIKLAHTDSDPRAEVLKSPAVDIKVLSDAPEVLRGNTALLSYLRDLRRFNFKSSRTE